MDATPKPGTVSDPAPTPPKLRIAHYPQVPCKPYYVSVPDLEAAVRMRNALCQYDLFQYRNNIQVPCNPYYVPVPDLEAAVRMRNALCQYDLFQYRNNIQPDCSNICGLEVYEPGVVEGDDWLDWHHPDTDEDFGEYCRREGGS